MPIFFHLLSYKFVYFYLFDFTPSLKRECSELNL